MKHFISTTMAVVLTTLSLAGTASAQGVRDCRASTEVVMPVVPSGFDAIAAHATDALMGPSIFERFAKTEDDADISINLRTYESYDDQVSDYLACETPFLRATPAMMTQLAEALDSDDRTRMVPIFTYGWSNGGTAIVGRTAASVNEIAGATLLVAPKDLDLALQIASETTPAATVKMTDDPARAFTLGEGDVVVTDAAQAQVLTAGHIGTGAEGSVDGARTILTTASASRVISDILVVRNDFFEANPDVVRGTVRSLLKAEELFREDVQKQVVDFELAAGIVLGDEALEDDLRDLWRGVETVGLKGQVDWATPTHPRSFRSQVNTGQNMAVKAGLLPAAVPLASPALDYASLGDDIWDKRRTTTSGFDQSAATAAIGAMSNEDIEGNTIASVTIYFEPRQFDFPVEQYRDAFEQALDKSMVYAGAVLVVEGHASYLGYVRGVVQEDWNAPKQKLEMQSLDRISTRRAMAVRSALITTAADMGLPIDDSQIAINGRGIEDPLGGFCRQGLPCPPKTETEWRESRRVIFRVVEMESEEEVFTPLVDFN